MSSNLLKRNYMNLQQDDVRLIAVNELMAKRLAAIGLSAQKKSPDGFVSGLPAEQIGDGEAPEYAETNGSFQSNIIKSNIDMEAACEEARNEAEMILAEAREQAERITQEAKVLAEQEKIKVFEQAKMQGYADGQEQARKENAKAQAKLQEKERQLEAEYQQLLEELEPKFVDAITGIYEHIFHIELRSYREVLSYLISTTMRKIEGNREFMIHVSKEDYPYISMQKKQLAAGAAASNSSVEIIEDMTLSKNECFIETEGGIFDCGVGTQLTELRQKLKLLSYEK